MAEAALTFLLENLQQLPGDQIHLISGAEYELKQLQDELISMKSFLQDSASKRVNSELFKTLEKQIRDVVYTAEDTIDACLLNQAAAGAINRKSKLQKNVFSLVTEIKSLRKHMVKLADEARMMFAALQSTDEAPVQDTVDRLPKISLPVERKIVGLADEASKIIKYLNEESYELEVISIIGMPGLGKTTLAMRICRDPFITYQFPIIIWVYVSEEYNKKDIFLTILKKFTQQDMSAKSVEELAQQVKKYLLTGKFLIVMDDVWTVDAWNQIEDALPKSNRQCKILITSRDQNVAQHANHDRLPHRLRFLNREECWELLQLEVFGKIGVCPPELENTGKHIADQCRGLPLAIVVIGGILVDKLSSIVDTKMEWKKVSDDVQTYMSNNDGRMENIISLSYDKLPYELRDCFLYLGMFPEDYEIPAWKLILLWIAEGFIRQKPGKSLEDVAEENLKELVNRNLVMVDKMKPEGEIKTCRVHDVIREFCKHEAAFNNQNLFQEIRMSKDGVFEPNISQLQKFRRICVHSYVVDFFLKKPKGPELRSFGCFSNSDISLESEYIKLVMDTFSLVRVFDANPIRFKKFPTKIRQLIHLRYIALSGDDFNFLPEGISMLWNLQTIIINTSSPTFDVKADISKMMQLRHLKTKAAIILTKKGKGQAGENLQTLTRLSPQCCTKQVFDKAPNLKTLGIHGQLVGLSDNKNLANMGRLEKLKLVNDAFPRVASENPLQGLPQPDWFPPNLRILTLSSTFQDWKHMSVLGMLNALEVLKLKDNAFMGKCWEVNAGGFNSLEYMYIARTNLQLWTFSGKDDHFPKLRCLVLKNCEKLHEVPTSLVEKLQILDMERVTKHAVTCARKIEQEKQMKYREQSTRRGGFKLIIAPGDK